MLNDDYMLHWNREEYELLVNIFFKFLVINYRSKYYDYS